MRKGEVIFGQALSKDIISELDAALRETDLTPETIDSIIRSLKLRRRRWVAVRSAVAVVAVAALCAVFYVGTMVGMRRVLQPVSSPESQVTKKTLSQPETTSLALTTEVLKISSETSVVPATSLVEAEPETEKIIEKSVEKSVEKNVEEMIEGEPASAVSEPSVSKKAASPVVQKPKAAVIEVHPLYAVELIGFFGPKESSGLNKKLRKQGYSSSLHKIKSPDGTVLHRVWIGHFKTPEKAREFIGKLRRAEGLEGKVVERTKD